MRPYIVYEIETAEGAYIGVTGRSLRTRLVELRCHRGFVGTIRPIAVFDNKAAALMLEQKLRPNYFIGLNRGKGGRCGMTPSPGSANGMARRVRVEGVEYPTAIAAAKAHGLTKTAIHYRLNAPRFSSWEYVS